MGWNAEIGRGTNRLAGRSRKKPEDVGSAWKKISADWIYEVRADGLPRELLQSAPTVLQTPTSSAPATAGTKTPARISASGSALARWRYEAIQLALREKPESEARAREIEKASLVDRKHLSGRVDRVSIRTIRRWIGTYQREGMAGLQRKTRAKSGWLLSRDPGVRSLGLPASGCRPSSRVLHF